jgi:hypothetical protein
MDSPAKAVFRLLVAVALVTCVVDTHHCACLAWTVRTAPTIFRSTTGRYSAAATTRLRLSTSTNGEPSTTNLLVDEKVKLVTLCTEGSKPSFSTVQSSVQALEQTAEDRGVGQSSSSTGLLNGEWYDKVWNSQTP